jgi:DNA-binding response OmpR family regulator
MAGVTSKWILVVEDDPKIREMLQRALEREYNIAAAEDGAMGLMRLMAEPKPDLVLADVMMPKVDGLAMVKRMKSDPKTAGIPVIFLTAREGSKDVIAGIQAGARHYVTKPFDLADLMAKVRKVLG